MTQSRSRGVVATLQGIDKIQTRRTEKEWTYETLAKKAGFSPDTLDRIIKRKSVDKDSILKIATVLDL